MRINLLNNHAACSSFTGDKHAKKYLKAQNHVDSTIKKFGHVDVLRFDKMKKAEGIQHGIKVFEGLNVKQIYLILERLNTGALFRGCSNRCVHCYADSKPVHVKKADTENIKAVLWEDFDSFTKGIAEINKRLKRGKPRAYLNDFEPFYDSDCMEIVLKDKHGIEHDFIDITKNIWNDLGKTTLFDTSGWNHKSPLLQKRAEKYVQFMLENSEKFNAINISLNPFHILNAKFIENINSNPQLAQKFRNTYTDRMANVFYTFTPLFNKSKFRILNRALDENLEANSLFKKNSHKALIQEIYDKLEKLYIKNNVPDYEKKLELFYYETLKINTDICAPIGRMKNILPENAPENFEIYENINKQFRKNHKHPASLLENTQGTLMFDCNGKVFLTNFLDVFPTDICLNFENKSKSTPQFFTKKHHKLKTSDLIYGTRSFILKIFKKPFKYLV